MNKSRLIYIYSIYILIIGTIGQFAPYLQAYKTFTTERAGDLSIPAYVVAFISLTSWLVYGALIKDYPLIISNIVGFIGTIIVIVGMIIYS
jgi:MtN3 and saliva related transmembrane protein